MADVNSFLPAAMPASPNEKPSAPADPNAPTQLGGDPVVEGVATQGTNAATSADGADNTRAISVPGENRAPRRPRGGRQREVFDRVNRGRENEGAETPVAEVDPRKLRQKSSSRPVVRHS